MRPQPPLLKQIVRGDRRQEVVPFNPERYRLGQAALDFSIEEAKRIKDWPALEEAVDAKIIEQVKFVAWWDANVQGTPRSRAHELNQQRAAFDGLIIFCEFSRAFTAWNDIKFGQRYVYEGLIRSSAHCAVLCRHNVDPTDERAIDSRLDIVSFQAMVWDFQIIRSKIMEGNHIWQDFIFHWFESSWGARKVRRQIIYKYGCGQ